MIDLATGWAVDVERGPNWLFVRLHGEDPTRQGDLAQELWNLLDQQFTSRLVLEMNEVPVLYSHLIGELVRLQKRIGANGGVLKLCGLSEAARESLATCRLDTHFARYANRTDAIMGDYPHLPR